ncbi:helix-turn-helix domain-containing protein [Streptomyces sp. NPDC008001]|uniref:helix-turn-helix domain-containing protein n=1 Tax=Streptomyces sp. NPDC008001 TaxID=3364804 RepID=UPI0036EF7C3D
MHSVNTPRRTQPGRKQPRKAMRVGARIGPTARRIALGTELRRMRNEAGMTLEQAVKGLGFSDSHLQRVETGSIALKQASHLRSLLKRYGITDEERIATLTQLHRESASQEWTSFASTVHPTARTFADIEGVARAIKAWHPTLILGLFQTKRYATAIFEMEKLHDETTTEYIEQSVRLRMMRRELLTRSEDPVHLWAILGEAALRHVVGDADVMREQYAEIAALSERENVTVQILRTHEVGYRFGTNFTILDLGETLPSTVQTDVPWGSLCMSDKPREVGRFSRKFSSLQATAMPPEKTVGFLQQLSREVSDA